MKFFLDACMPYSSKEVFERFAEVGHARDAGLAKAVDKEIIEYASRHKAIIVSKDLEFANIIFYPINLHCGVILLRLPSYFTARQINSILEEFLNSVDIKELINSITIVEAGRYRIRK